MSPAPTAPATQIVDATALAISAATVSRAYTLSELARVGEAGGLAGTKVAATFRFFDRDESVAIDGSVTGTVVLSCQRCLAPFQFVIDEPFALAVVTDEQEATAVTEPYEAVIADPSHLDLSWVAEEQVLLALPFAPKHESEEICDREVEMAALAPSTRAAHIKQEAVDRDKQRPFADLRDMLRKS